MDIICFHNPDEDNGYLSNWYLSSFTVDGVAFSSMEQFMMYRKAICFGDEAVAAQILSTSDVAKIKSLGRQVSNYDESMWNGIRQIVVYEGLLAKFSQNEELKGKLKATENAVLAECAVKDCIWGIGLSMKDPDRLNKAKWNGQNLLGYALMMVRERLQQDYSWEQRKFSELYEKVSRKNDLTYGKDDIISVANMYFKADSYITDESYLLTYNIFELGDIAFEGNKSKNYAHGRFVENTIGNGIVSHVFDVFKPIMKPYDLQFWKYAINNEQLMGGILLRSTKASTMMTNLVANDFLQETFLVPVYPEQQKIGAFFQELDRLITLHQRKPDCYQFKLDNERITKSTSLFSSS